MLEKVGDEKKAFNLFLQWKCLTDLYFLGTEIFGWKNATDITGRRHRVDPKFHKWLCSKLDLPGDKMLLVPRLHLKTTWVKLKIIQEILKNPNIRIGLFSVTSRLVEQELRDIKTMLCNPALRELFPDIIPNPGKDYKNWEKSTANELTTHRDHRSGKPPQEPQVTALGSGAKIVGMHIDIAFCDDIIDPSTVTTAEQMRKTEDWWSYIQSILELGAPVTITGTFYHYNDLYNKIIRDKHFPKDRVFIRKAIENNEIVYKSWFTFKDLDRIKKRQGNYIFNCNPGYAPIWMADYSFKNIEDVRIGDEVIGYEIHAGSGKRRKLIKTKVEEINSREAETVCITLKSGKKIICTPDHRWFTGRNGTDFHATYLPAKTGRSLINFIDPKTQRGEIKDWSWLAGMIDGEGACKYGSICISQSHELNPQVCEKLENVLKNLNIDYKIYQDKDNRKDDIERKKSLMYVLNGGRQTKVDILSYGDPAKKDQIIKNMWDRPGMKAKKDKVVKIEPTGRREKVYALKTESGNYVAWGYASKNCQYLLDPIPREDQIFPGPQPTFIQLPQGDYTYYITVDPSLGKEHSDETGIVVAAVNKLKTIYIVEAIGVKKNSNELADLIIQKVLQYKPFKVGIEFGLQGHLQYIIEARRSVFEKLLHKGIPMFIEPIPITKGVSKSSRVSWTLGAFVRQNKLFIHESCRDMIAEMDTFTGKGNEKDNIVDAASMLITLIGDFHSSPYAVEERKTRGTFWDLFRKKPQNSWRENFA